MEDKYIAILGGLTGSSFTIIVNKVFDYFQTRQLHKQELKKEFFLRKLNVYEKAVSLWTVAHSSISNMAILMKTATNENVSFSDEQSKDIFAKLQKNVNQVYEATQETAYSIGLYVDLKHEDKEIEETYRFWELLGTINQLISDVNYWYDLQESVTNPEDYNKLEVQINLSTEKVKTDVENLFDISNVMRKRLLSFTNTLREEMKSYK